MKFNIGDFTIITNKKSEELDERFIAPRSVKNNKPANFMWKYKIREFTIFRKLGFKGSLIADNIFDFISLIEAIKGFAGNRYQAKKIYTINDLISTKMALKDDYPYLKLTLSKYTLHLDKLECSILSSQLSKIAQRCEAWQEQEA